MRSCTLTTQQHCGLEILQLVQFLIIKSSVFTTGFICWECCTTANYLAILYCLLDASILKSFSITSDKLQCTIAAIFNLKYFNHMLLYVGIHIGILRHFLLEFVYLLLSLYITIAIRLRYHDPFGYDESDRNYDMRSIRLRYDYDEKLTCSFCAGVEWKQTRAMRRIRIVVESQLYHGVGRLRCIVQFSICLILNLIF